MPFFWKRVQGFGQEAVIFHQQSYFTSTGSENVPMGLYKVSDIKKVQEEVVTLFTQEVPTEHKLDFACAIGYVGEGQSSHVADGDKPSGKGYFLLAEIFIPLKGFPSLFYGVSSVNFCGVRVYSELPQPLQLAQAMVKLVR